MITSVKASVVWKIHRVKPKNPLRVTVGNIVNVIYKDDTKSPQYCYGEILELDYDFITILDKKTQRPIELSKWQIEDLAV